MILAGALDRLETDQRLFSRRLSRVVRKIGGGRPALPPVFANAPMGRTIVLCSAANWDTYETSQLLGGTAELPYVARAAAVKNRQSGTKSLAAPLSALTFKKGYRASRFAGAEWTTDDPKARFGIPGLDDVLFGGLRRNRLFLFEGTPGAGKTTLGLQFLLEGARSGEKGLYVTLSETDAELRETTVSHGWSIGDGIDIYELLPPESLLDEEQQQSLLYSSDLELGETTKRIFEAMERSKPQRVVIDSLSEIRLLAQSSLRYRRQILALKHYFSQRDATVLLLDDLTAGVDDKTVHSVAHGVVRMEELTPDYGAERRRLRVMKYRGQPFRGGYHDFTIKTGGVEVFPRLVAAEHRTRTRSFVLTSGIGEFDRLLGGGIEGGSSTLILGPAGTGKSLIVLTMAVAAIDRGERAALFIFDEELGVLFTRSKGTGIDLERMRDSGGLIIDALIEA
jgi:circadian clock protein KaiC